MMMHGLANFKQPKTLALNSYVEHYIHRFLHRAKQIRNCILIFA